VAAQRDELQVNEPAELENPIEFLTENGFVILRSWEIDRAPAPTNGTFSFVVRSERDPQREIIVTISDKIITDISWRTRGRINCSSSFWISSAERHLAAYLWEQEDFPEGNRLTVRQLDPDEIISALNWRT